MPTKPQKIFQFYFSSEALDSIQFEVLYGYSLSNMITDKLLPFDLLSILILDKLCMNLLCLYRYFL